MRTPSYKYLYGVTGTFGTNVNVTAADYAQVDREIAAECAARRPALLRPEVVPYASIEIIRTPAVPVQAVERTIEDAQRASFHALITNPATASKLDQMLADNDAVVDAREDAHDGPACGPSCFHAYLTDPDDRDDDGQGDACSRACGFCGRCS